MVTVANNPTDPASWWAGVIADPPMAYCLALLLGSLMVMVLLSRAMFRLRGGRRPTGAGGNLLREQGGTAMLEFVLVLPIFFALVFLLAQTMLVMVGNVFIHYAAYAATRSAVTTIPADHWQDGEPPNVVWMSGGDSGKLETIRRAAIFAVMPAAGRLTLEHAPAESRAEELKALAEHFGGPSARWLERMVLDRYRYAEVNTAVALMRAYTDDVDHLYFLPLPDDGEYTFGPKEPLTVRVWHRQALTVPWVSLVFVADRDDPASYEHDPGTGEGMYRWLRAQYTMNNEGISRELPPTPRYLHPIDNTWELLEREQVAESY